MSTQQISRRYARALYELINEGADIQDPLNRLAQVAALEEVHGVLASPRYDAAVKASILEQAVKGALSKEVKNLVRILCERNKAVLLPEIAEMVEQMVRQAKREVDAEVISAVPLDAERKKKLAKSLGKLVDRKVNIHTREDKSILGGLVILVGDRKIDLSLRNKLDSLRKTLAA